MKRVTLGAVLRECKRRGIRFDILNNDGIDTKEIIKNMEAVHKLYGKCFSTIYNGLVYLISDFKNAQRNLSKDALEENKDLIMWISKNINSTLQYASLFDKSNEKLLFRAWHLR